MKAIRRFNNNIVLCVDDNGQEVVAFGKGLGFHELPYEVELKNIEKSYYGIENHYFNLINYLSPASLEISGKVLNICRANLKGAINPNLQFTMADHIDFCINRYKKGIRVKMPLSYDIENLHPKEYEIAKIVLKEIEKQFKIRLLKDEIAGIAMNILNAEVDYESNNRYKSIEVTINEVTKIIESGEGYDIGRDSANFARFASHMQYLEKRIVDGNPFENNNEEIYATLVQEYPKAANYANEISDYFVQTKNFKLNQEELLYLILHINRLCSREECYQ